MKVKGAEEQGTEQDGKSREYLKKGRGGEGADGRREGGKGGLRGGEGLEGEGNGWVAHG